MFRLSVIISLLCNCGGIHSIERQYKGTPSSPVDTRLDADPIQTLKTSSLVQCLVVCVSKPGCKSFNFGRGNCELLSTFYCEWNANFVSSIGMTYYDIDVRTRNERESGVQSSDDCRARSMCSDKCDLTRTLGKSCENEVICDDVIGATCSRGRCQCEAEYHFNRREDSCVTDCESYGATFTATRGYALTDHNDVVELSGHTFYTCRDACLAAIFTCRSFEFSSTVGACLLSSESCASPGLGLCIVNDHYDYFSRDCA